MDDLVRNDEGIATARLNPGRVLDYTRQTLPVLGVDGWGSLEHVVVLKAGMAGDVASYEALVPATMLAGPGALKAIAQFGNKLRGIDAARIWPNLMQIGEYRR